MSFLIDADIFAIIARITLLRHFAEFDAAADIGRH
jgi:hypothetical protein